MILSKMAKKADNKDLKMQTQSEPNLRNNNKSKPVYIQMKTKILNIEAPHMYGDAVSFFL